MPLLLSWFLACSGASPQPEDVELAASIGTGDWEWHELEDGDGIVLLALEVQQVRSASVDQRTWRGPSL